MSNNEGRNIGTNKLIDGRKLDAIELNIQGNIDVLSIGSGNISDAEFNALEGITGNIQEQIDNATDFTPAITQLQEVTTQIQNNLGDLDMLKANVEDVNAGLDTKADMTYVDTELSLKADVGVSYTKAEEDALLATKANSSYVDSELATKADALDHYNITEIDAALALKADKSDTYTKSQVDAELAGKADITDVNTALGTKADISYVNDELATKANSSDVTTALGTKADISYVNDLSSTKLFTYKDDLFRTAPFASSDGPTFSFFQAGGVLTTNNSKANFFSSTDIVNGFYGFHYVYTQSAFANESIGIGYKTTRSLYPNINTLNLGSIKLYEIESRVKLLPLIHNTKRGEFRMGLGAGGIATNGGYLYTGNASTPATTAYFIRYIQTTGELGIHTRSGGSETFTVLATLNDAQASSLNTLKISFVNVSGSVSISLIMNGIVLGSVSTNIDLITCLDVSIMYVLLYGATYVGTAGIAIDNILFTEGFNI